MSEMTLDQMKEVQTIKLLRDLDDLTGLFEIMVFLNKFERGNISTFIKDLGLNQQPAYRTLGKLEQLGLVQVQKRVPPTRRTYQSKYYSFTASGRELSNYFVDLFETYRDLTDTDR